jgi:hypothetical protein
MLIDIDSLDRAHYGPVHVRGWAGDSGCQEAGEPQSREASGAGAGDPFPRVRRRGSWARRVVGLFETWLNHGLQRSIDTSVDVFADVLQAPATTKFTARYGQARSRS